MTLSRIPFDHAHLAARRGSGWPLALFLGLVLCAAPALGQDQKGCINELNKGFGKVAKTQGKDIGKCIKDGSKGKLVAQSIEECITADNKGKVAKAQQKTISKASPLCSPPPDFGPSDPNTVNQAAVEKELALIHEIFGSDLDAVILDAGVNKDGAKCQVDVAKAAQKCQDTKLKEFNKCKKAGLKDGSITSALGLEACMGVDEKGKIAKACETKLQGTIDKKCVGQDPDALFPGCAGEVLQTCLDVFVECAVCVALNEADNLARFCDLFDDDQVNGSCRSGGVPNAVARLITDSADFIGGPLARGRLGDYYLANDKIRVIVQKPQRNFAGIGLFGGNIIDADLQRAEGEPDRDIFEEWVFMLNLENTANYTNVFVLNDGSDGNPAIIRAMGVDDLLDYINASTVVTDFGIPYPEALDDKDQPVDITTDYILAGGDNFVRMETTVTNTDPNTIGLFLGDFLSPLAQEVFHPGYGIGEPLVTTDDACDAEVIPCDFIAYSGEGDAGGVSYGYINTTPGTTSFNTDGVQVPILGSSAVLTLIGAVGPNFDVPPEGSVTVTRYLAIGDGDVAAIVDVRNQLKGLSIGKIKGQVTENGTPVADAEIAVIGPAAAGPGTDTNVSSSFRTDPNGNYAGTLPPADYELRVHKEGYLFASPDPASVSLSAGQTLTQDFTLAEPGHVRVTIADPNAAPLAAKVSIVGFDPSLDPGNTQNVLDLINNRMGVFGDVTKDRLEHGIARIVFVDHTGDSGEFPLEPGDYQVVVSHGTEFSIHTQDISLLGGGSVLVDAELAHVVDTSGFVSGDFHVHSFDSTDCKVTRKERIVSMLAEGVDFFTPSDHEFRIDFTQDIADLGVADLVSTAVNNEITTFDYGHFGGFPMTVDPNQSNFGAVDWGREAPPGQDFPSLGAYGLSPGEIYDVVQSDPGENTVHIHHVASFFDGGLRFDTGLVPPQSFGDPTAVRLDPNVPNFWDPDFTALELWIQTSRGQDFGNFLGENAGNWFNLLNQGLVRTGISDSDTHQVFLYLAGFPRNMIASPTDDPGALAAIAETLAENVNDGRVTGTNGPFLRVSLEGDPNEVGGLEEGMDTLVTASGGSATISVDIQSPTWAEFDTVEYYVNSETVATDPNERPGLPPLYRICPDYVQVAGVDFTVNTVPAGGGDRLEATTSLSLSGLTQDAWVVVMVKGTDDVSCPLFPVIPNDLDPNSNATLADLKSCDAGDLGVTALAYSNPLFIDVTNLGVYDSPGLQFQSSCP